VSAVPTALDEAWNEVELYWDDVKRHDALLGLVAHFSAYQWAAGKYRQHGSDPIAKRQLDRIRKSAIATMFATQTRKRETEKLPFRGSLLVLLIVAILAGTGLMYLQFRKDHVTQADGS